MLEINLQKKVAIVTGVSSGIGKGVAKMLAQAGCTVSGCGRTNESDPSVQEFFLSAKENDVDAIYTQVDVTKTEDLQKLVKHTIEKFGKLDILVSNAGVNVFKGAEKCNLE